MIYRFQALGLDIKVATLVFEVSNRVLKMFERYLLSCFNLQHSFSSFYTMDYKMTGLETCDHVGCFRFADWLLLSFKMAATEWKFVT